MHRNKSVDTHRFAMTPRAEIPRSSFRIEKTHKTTFDAGLLIPIYCEEVLPGDTFNLRMTAFCRMATPLYPLMDNLTLDTFFFFVPNRLVWYHWRNMMGERSEPASSIDFLVPQCVSPAGGYPIGSIFDYLGLPTVGQVGVGATVSHSVLPLRAYNLIWNEWFRDENLQNTVETRTNSDGPDASTDYQLLRRGKRHDYFTSCLPWPQKGQSVTLPLGTKAPVMLDTGSTQQMRLVDQSTSLPFGTAQNVSTLADSGLAVGDIGAGQIAAVLDPAGRMFADLSQATAATINQLRQSFQVQKLLERDARGGTRYTELLRSHFGVSSPDARLQRPEYLGGGSTPIVANPIAQTSATGVQGGTTPLGQLGAMATGLSHGNGFSSSFVEHGVVLGLACVRADLTYQQGLRKMWSRRTRYDFYWPAFAMLGEQAVLSKEIFCDGSAGDESVFGYQERWSEYRYSPSEITGLFRSTAAGTLDGWHLSQRFTVRPTLAPTFIQETPPMDRVLAMGATADGAHFIADMLFQCHAARPLPLYSVPGLIDHF